jgi:hypothetical protein
MKENARSSTPLKTRFIAVVVLLIAAWVLLHLVIGIAIAIASVVAVVVAIIALIWALNVLF